MKRKIFVSLTALFIISILGSAVVALYIRSAAQGLDNGTEWVWSMLAGTVTVTLIAGAVAAWNLIKGIAHPVNILVMATRMIASGDAGIPLTARTRPSWASSRPTSMP